MKKRSLSLVLLCILSLLLLLCVGCKKSEAAEEDLTPPIKPVVTVPSTDPAEPEVTPETDPEPEPDPEPETYVGTVYNTDNGVNVRKEPSTEAEILTAADVGEVFTVLEVGEWCKIQLPDGSVGYIKGEFLQLAPAA